MPQTRDLHAPGNRLLLAGGFFVCALLAVAGLVRAEQFELDVIETDDLRLIYIDPFQTYLVPHVARNFHNSLKFQEKVFKWEPHEKSTILLTDFADYGNAGASASPYNGVMVSIAPASRTLETMPSSERMFMLMNHELVHIANMDVANSQDNRWRRFFAGKPRQSQEHPESILYNYLTVPRLSAPRWYLEGAAVFMETWMSGGLGRAQGAFDEMVFRAKVRDGGHFYSSLGIVSEGVAVDFQTGVNAYLYGTRFISYVAYTYSPEQVIEWLSRSEDSERYYSAQFRKVFGKSLDDAWDDWIRFEKDFQGSNLRAIRQYPLTPAKTLTTRTLGSISKSYYDPQTNSLIGAFRYPGVVAHVGVLSLDSGDLRRVVDIKGPMKYRVASTAWDASARTLFFAADNGAYRDLMAVNVDTGKTRMLIEDGRIGDLAFNEKDKSLWGLRHLNGYVTLVRMEAPYEEWELVLAWDYGRVAYEMDISDDGEYLSTSLGEIDGKQALKVYRIADLLDGKGSPELEFDFGDAVPEGFVFTPDGKYLYGSSFYTGVSNIFRYELATGDLEAVSNAESGFFRPIPMADGSLIVSEYSGDGFSPKRIDPVPLEDVSAITFLGSEIAKKHPVVREWNTIGTLKDVDLAALDVKPGKYRPLRELRLDSAYPIVEGYRDSQAFGWFAQWRDPAQFNSVQASVSYSLSGPQDSDENLHFSLQYQGLNWHAQYWHNDADFYDLFGPTKRARKGDAFIVGYDRTLIYDEPRTLSVSAKLSHYRGLDTLPNNQNVETFFFDQFTSFYSALNYSNTRRSLGAVDHEKGWQWSLGGSIDNSEFDTYYKPLALLDFGVALPWKHSSLWLYNAAGTSNGNPQDPLSRFYFGGFGNNYVDDGEVKRYREYWSLPGFELDEISGQDFAKSVVELNLPPVRFREVGIPSLFLSHARPALFAGALRAEAGRESRSVSSLGFQMDFAFTLAHRLPMTLSVGVATGFEDGDQQDTEWMLSLKIL